MTSVQLQRIDQSFGNKHVLRQLDLQVDRGQYVVLLGESGCGKTTTLRIIAGLQTPDAGDVLLGGERVNQLAPRHRDVAMVFQQDSLYPHLTVGDSIRFPLRGKLDSSEIETRLAEAAELTGTEAILDRYPDRLSGGELRRAAVAKAIARRASVRLLDEPLSALDAPLRHALQDDILLWHQSVPGTSIHVTHDGQEAMRMADKIAVMEAGKVIQFATPDQVFARPASVSVARAIGSPPINLLSTSVADGTIKSNRSDVSCRLHGKFNDRHHDLLIGVRPEALRIVGEDQSNSIAETGLLVSGTVIRRRRLQGSIQIYLGTGQAPLLAVVPDHAASDHDNGQAIELYAARQDVHLFDAETGCRADDSILR